jgi:hypothetical protein
VPGDTSYVGHVGQPILWNWGISFGLHYCLVLRFASGATLNEAGKKSFVVSTRVDSFKKNSTLAAAVRQRPRPRSASRLLLQQESRMKRPSQVDGNRQTISGSAFFETRRRVLPPCAGASTGASDDDVLAYASNGVRAAAPLTATPSCNAVT